MLQETFLSSVFVHLLETLHWMDSTSCRDTTYCLVCFNFRITKGELRGASGIYDSPNKTPMRQFRVSWQPEPRTGTLPGPKEEKLRSKQSEPHMNLGRFNTLWCFFYIIPHVTLRGENFWLQIHHSWPLTFTLLFFFVVAVNHITYLYCTCEPNRTAAKSVLEAEQRHASQDLTAAGNAGGAFRDPDCRSNVVQWFSWWIKPPGGETSQVYSSSSNSQLEQRRLWGTSLKLFRLKLQKLIWAKWHQVINRRSFYCCTVYLFLFIFSFICKGSLCALKCVTIIKCMI